MRSSARRRRRPAGRQVRAKGDLARKRRGEPNGLEARYLEHLELRQLAGELAAFRFEGVKLRLGTGSWYTADALVIASDGFVELHEVKGHWREAARVRIKVAASEYPWFRFVAVTHPRGEGWTFEEISA